MTPFLRFSPVGAFYVEIVTLKSWRRKSDPAKSSGVIGRFSILQMTFSLAALLGVGVVCAAEGPVLVDGSSSVYPVTAHAAEAFTEETGIPVQVKFSGTSAGFRKFLAEEIPITDASRPILKKEIEEAERRGIEFIEIPIAFDALTIVTHPKNTWLTDIKTSELEKIWSASSQGKVIRWNQIRPEWPDDPIHLVGAGGDSGTRDFFGEVITGDTEGLRTDYLGSEDDSVLVEEVATNPNGFGFLPHAYLIGNEDRIKVVPVAWDIDARTGRITGGKPVKPTRRNVVAGAYIPLARPLFLYANAKMLEADPRAVRFLEYLLTEGRSAIHNAGYVTLNEQAYVQALQDLETKDTGTRFGGEIPVGIAIHDLLTLEPK